MEEESQVMKAVYVTESAASPEPGVKVVEEKEERRRAVYPIRSFHDENLVAFVDKHEPSRGKSLSDSVDLIFSDLPYNVRSSWEDGNSH